MKDTKIEDEDYLLLTYAAIAKKDNEIKTLKQRLNQAYEFMKQFTIGGINMLEKFLQSVGERVQNMVAGRGR